jgi:hypothetical protein
MAGVSESLLVGPGRGCGARKAGVSGPQARTGRLGERARDGRDSETEFGSLSAGPASCMCGHSARYCRVAVSANSLPGRLRRRRRGAGLSRSRSRPGRAAAMARRRHWHLHRRGAAAAARPPRRRGPESPAVRSARASHGALAPPTRSLRLATTQYSGDY